MLNKKSKLNPDTLDLDKLEQIPTRNGFGEGLVEAGEKDERVIVLCADLAESTRVHWFRDKFPERYIEIGVAEQNLAAVASGFASYGKIPFIASYATFSPGRNNEQIRTTIALNDVPVKIAGAHAGVSVGPDGATHQALEDIALMRVIPNMTVIVPCDSEEAKKATIEAAKTNKPAYVRFGREKTPIFTTKDTPFEIGKAQTFYESKKPKATIFGCGAVLHNALLAAGELAEEGIEVNVINLATVKPLDEKAIIKAAKETGAIVTVEEHQIAGGMGSAVAEFLAKNYPVPIEFVGVDDKFGQSGEPNELIEFYGMGVKSIKEKVKKVLKKK